MALNDKFGKHVSGTYPHINTYECVGIWIGI